MSGNTKFKKGDRVVQIFQDYFVTRIGWKGEVHHVRYGMVWAIWDDNSLGTVQVSKHHLHIETKLEQALR